MNKIESTFCVGDEVRFLYDIYDFDDKLIAKKYQTATIIEINEKNKCCNVSEFGWVYFHSIEKNKNDKI